MIADFGLTTYLVRGSDVQNFYFKSTTDNIEPPEGNNALKGFVIGQSYDIWSLGCILAYTIRRFMDFNMWDPDQWNMDDWRNQVKSFHYNTVIKTILDYFPSNLALRNPKPSAVFLESAKDLLSKMLTVNPPERPSIDEILKHKWFDGLTLPNAIDTVRNLLGSRAAFGNTWKSKIMTNTRRIRNANTRLRSHRNAEVASYFQIAKQPLVSRFLNDELHAKLKVPVKKLLEIIPNLFKEARNPPRHCLYTYLHGLELYNRVVLKDNRFSIYLPICFNIALKNTPDANLHAFYYKLMAKMGRFSGEDDYIKQEANIIRLLNGDTYPQVGGLVDKVVQKIGSMRDKVSAARKILDNIFERSATFVEYVDISDTHDTNSDSNSSTNSNSNSNTNDKENILEGFPRI